MTLPITAFVRAGPLVVPGVGNSFGIQERVKRFHAMIRTCATGADFVIASGDIKPDAQLFYGVCVFNKPDWIELIKPIGIVHKINRAVGLAERWTVSADHFEDFGMDQS